MANRNQMSGPMSLEDYAAQGVWDWAARPMDLSGLGELPDMGALHTAGVGDSVSAIMGSSDPAAIGAFMQANGLKDSGLRAGERYLIPRRADLAADGTAVRGQAMLNADNARATQRAQAGIAGSMAGIDRTVSSFDPLKGILATRPAAPVQQGVLASQAGETFHRASKGVDIAGKILDGFNVQNAALGLLDGGRAAATLGKVTGPLGAVLVPLEHGFEGIAEIKEGAPAGTVALGVAGKTGGTGLGIGVGMGVGALAGPWAPIAMPVGAAVGSWIAGGLMKNTTNEAMGRKLLPAGEAFGRYPYYDGGAGWPVFPSR